MSKTLERLISQGKVRIISTTNQKIVAAWED